MKHQTPPRETEDLQPQARTRDLEVHNHDRQISLKHQAVPRARTKDIVTRDTPGEVLVYDLANHKAHCLNQVAATVWKYCDGQLSIAKIATQMSIELNYSIDETTVWMAVERLSRAELLERPIAFSANDMRLSRRKTLKRLSIGTTVAVPFVMSIIAPTVQAACTVGANGTTCVAGGGVGDTGIVPTTVCCSTCCSGGNPSRCVTLGLLAPGDPCNRGCHCASGVCINTPGPGGTCS